MEDTMPNSVKKQGTARAVYVALALVFLIPVFFVPSPLAPFLFSKTMLAVAALAILAALIFWRSFTERSLTVPRSPLLAALWVLPAAYFISSVFSVSPSASFFGYQLESDTFGFILLATGLTTALVLVLQHKGRVLSSLVALLFAAWVVFLFQAFQIVFSAPLPLLGDPSANLIGRWNDFGIFAGLIGALVLLTLESLPLPAVHTILLSATYAAALVFMALVNRQEVWVLFGATAFATLTLALTRRFFASGVRPGVAKSGILSVIGLGVAVVFLAFGGAFAPTLQQAAGVNSFDVRPSAQSTLGVLQEVYQKSPLVGSGPNTFATDWLRYRSADIVQTPFWNLSFNTGSSFFLSAAATGGLAVALAWLAIILGLLVAVVRRFFTADAAEVQSYFVMSMAALGLLFLLGAHALYTPSVSVTLLLFVFIALFLASSGAPTGERALTISFNGTSRSGFAFVFVGLTLLIILSSGVYGAAKAYASSFYHNQAIAAANGGDVAGGLSALGKAIALAPQDRYYRTAALIRLAEMNRIVGTNDTGVEAQTAFRDALSGAVGATAAALQRNGASFENLMLRGLVYQSVIPLGIDGAFDNASAVYGEARTLNPHDPEIDLRLAQMHRAKGDTAAAKAALTEALRKKADYTDAILLLAQLELDGGNLERAIASVESAIFFEPQNSILQYQLGILLLQDAAYAPAAAAFEAAVSQAPNFANARFFLAQSYAFLGRFAEATSLMEGLAAENPDNTLVASYRTALASETNPFVQAPTPPQEVEEAIE